MFAWVGILCFVACSLVHLLVVRAVWDCVWLLGVVTDDFCGRFLCDCWLFVWWVVLMLFEVVCLVFDLRSIACYAVWLLYGGFDACVVWIWWFCGIC